MVTVDVVIVNYNSGGALACALACLEKSVLTVGLRSVTVVDNASSDNSAENVRALLPLTLMRSKKNMGFGAACNLGAARGCAQFIAFMNPDVFVKPDTLDHAVLALACREECGALGIRLTDEHGQPQPSRMRFPTARDFVARSLGLTHAFPRIFSTHFEDGPTGQCDCVLGAFLTVRRTAFEQVGGFDERFFLYYEEIDLTQRLARKGWLCAYLPATSARHIGGVCTRSASAKKPALKHALASKRLYARRYFSRGTANFACAATYIENVLRRLTR